MNEDLKVKGEVHIHVKREDGTEEHYHRQNLVVDAGKAFVASRLMGTTQQPMSHIAVGSGAAEPVGSQVRLVTELGRKAAAVSIVTETVTGDAVKYAATFGANEGTGAIAEMGLFNADTAGTMMSRLAFPVINKGANDTITFEWILIVK